MPNTKQPPILQMKNVSVELGGQVIFEDVSLSIYPGESIVIIGPSGHGKTVLIKTLAGIFPPKKGKVLIEGEDWQALESEEKHHLAEKIGMLFQKEGLFDSMTVADNIKFPLTEHTHLSEAKMEERISELLTMVNLTDAHDKYPHELSGGMQRRLGIARALALSPQVVFYDDPTAGQDPVQSDAMADHILKIKEKFNSTLITITSDILRAYQMADRIFMVVDRQVIEAGTPKSISDNPDPRVQQFINGDVEGPIQYR